MKKNPAKKSAAGARHQWLDWEDEMLRHCGALITLAGLLLHSEEDGLSSDLVCDTGALMKREAEQLKTRLLARPGREARR